MKNASISWLLLLLININVMIGAGIFVYPSVIASYAGYLGFLSFASVFFIMLPLVLTVAQLAAVLPAGEGGLYTYSAQVLGKKIGVMNGIIYFVAKAISCSIMIRTVVVYLNSLFPAFSSVPVWVLRLIIIFLLVLFNLFGMRVGARMQAGFTTFKILPIIVVVLGGLWLFKGGNLTIFPASLHSFTSSLPLALYTMMGFETCCAIGHTVGNARQMARIIIASFFVVTSIYMLFQFSLFGALGEQLALTTTPLSLFFSTLFNSQLLSFIGVVAVILSAIGAAYGILYANNWYLFAIGRDLVYRPLTSTNKYGIPVLSALIHGAVIAFLLVVPASIALLGKCAVFGVLISYLTMVISLLVLYRTRSKELTLPYSIVVLSIASCVIMAFLCIKDLL